MSKLRLASLGMAATTVMLISAPLAAAHWNSETSTVRTSAEKTSIVIVTAGKPSEYAFRISPTSVKRGTVIFKITNLGKRPHSFSINGRASEVVRSHKSTTLRVVFRKPSRYLYADGCIVPPNQQEGTPATPCGGGFLKVT
jgi:hypothetical protein